MTTAWQLWLQLSTQTVEVGLQQVLNALIAFELPVQVLEQLSLILMGNEALEMAGKPDRPVMSIKVYVPQVLPVHVAGVTWGLFHLEKIGVSGLRDLEIFLYVD